MRLIDADLVIDTVNEFKGKNRQTDLGIKLVEEIVSNAPTVDAERHGHWLMDKGYNECSICGCNEVVTPYCPWCGAKMDEVEEDEKICDNCHYCIEKSNKNKGAELHTIHFKCILPEEKNVNPDDGCDKWTQRSGKRKIRYKDGEIDEID